MKKLLFAVAAIAFAFVACKKKKDDSACEFPETYSYKYANNKQVDTARLPTGVLYASIHSGTKTVFGYEYTSSSCVQLMDAGYVDQLVFEVPAGSSSFDFDTDAELVAANAYFTRSCYCIPSGARHVTGRIKGTRNGNSWNVQVRVTEPIAQIDVDFYKIFKTD